MNTVPAVTHTITIEEVDQDTRRATPSPLLVKGGDYVIFDNQTKKAVKIQFSKMSVFGKPGLIVPGGDPSSPQPVAQLPDLVVCPYAVYCTDNGTYAHGSAMPIIIDDPKT